MHSDTWLVHVHDVLDPQLAAVLQEVLFCRLETVVVQRPVVVSQVKLVSHWLLEVHAAPSLPTHSFWLSVTVVDCAPPAHTVLGASIQTPVFVSHWFASAHCVKLVQALVATQV